MIPYPPNTRRWVKGDYVIHDADRKNWFMLMVVVGYTPDGYVKTRYVNRAKMNRRWRGVLENPLAWLHDPARFNIEVPA
jgi:hypothetical protein